MAEFDYNAQMAYVAQIQAGSIDIMVMPEKLYQTLKKNEPFADLKELMGEEAFEKFGMQTDTTHISITDSELEQEIRCNLRSCMHCSAVFSTESGKRSKMDKKS